MIPSIYDLENWISANHPEVLTVTRYLQPSTQYTCWFDIWKDAGSDVANFKDQLFDEKPSN
tara:strand:+ start:2836 stop:3018 length:183 start_codon:yes stop_codon:yes gene_type:complete